MWQDPKSNANNTVVGCEKSICADIKADDFVKVTGYIKGEFEGKNMMGGTVTGPQIMAESVEKSTYMDVIAPAKKTVEVNQTKEQHGIQMTVTKVDFAETETRVYLSIDNQSSNKFMFYSFNTKVTQGSNQYDEDKDYSADYPQINSEILAGIKSEGILTFPALEESNFKLICEGHSDDYKLDFEDFVFDIEVK